MAWNSPVGILWNAFRKNFTTLVVVGESDDGKIEVFSNVPGKKSNSILTKAIRQTKVG